MQNYNDYGDFSRIAEVNGIDAYYERGSAKSPPEPAKTPVKGNLLLIKPASQWIDEAKARPIPKKLFDSFWYEGEVCILFADTNQGKSILAVQIADQITSGICTNHFKVEARNQPVLYFDFELSDKQFEARYSENYQNHYRFDPNFYRVEINPDGEIPEGLVFEDYLVQSIEGAVKQTRAKVLVIDNLTYLKTENEKSRNALPLMKDLKLLKAKHGLSILLLAHTPKRDSTRPITRNDLAGSKMLINFCDSAFAIGESQQDKNLRYLKQVKVRACEVVYDTENVLTCQIEKPGSFLSFSFVGYGNERDHLRARSKDDEESLASEVLRLHKEGKSYRAIADELAVNHMKVKRIVDRNPEPEDIPF